MGDQAFQRVAIVFLFGVLVLVGIQTNSAIDLRYHWAAAPALLGVAALMALRFSATVRDQIVAVYGLLIALCLLWATWREGMSSWNMLVGLMPMTDAESYFASAQYILGGLPITDAAGRRPMFTAYFSGILGSVGNNLRNALVVITILVMASLMFGLRVLRMPYVVAVTFVIAFFLYYRRFVGTVLTEQLGLMLGMIAFAFLLRGAKDRAQHLVAGGLFFLTLALNARAGPFLVLPCLIAWFSYQYAKPMQIISWRWLVYLSGAVIAGFLFNLVVLFLMDGERAAAFSNFSYSLYGLVYGGDWTLANIHHPELSTLPANAQAEAVYRLAFAKIIDQPTSLILGALRAWAVFLPTIYIFAASHHSMAVALIPQLLLSLLALIGLLSCLQTRKDAVSSMILIAVFGIWLSVPFVPPWDSDQMRAYAAVMPFLFFLPALGARSLFSKKNLPVDLDDISSSISKQYLVGGLCAVFALCLLLPIAVRGKYHGYTADTDKSSVLCGGRGSPGYVEFIPGTFQSIGDNRDRFDIKAVGKTFLVNPLAGLQKAISLSGENSAIPMAVVERNALPEYAPEAVRLFAKSLNAGDYIGLAWVRGESGGGEVRRVLLKTDSPLHSTMPKHLCLQTAPDLLGTLRLIHPN